MNNESAFLFIPSCFYSDENIVLVLSTGDQGITHRHAYCLISEPVEKMYLLG